jgi:hypothetical protein
MTSVRLMIDKLLELSLTNRVLVVALYLGLGKKGCWAVGASRCAIAVGLRVLDDLRDL